jgi:hypothetical protein
MEPWWMDYTLLTTPMNQGMLAKHHFLGFESFFYLKKNTLMNDFNKLQAHLII